MADAIKAAAHCSHRKVQPAPKYTFNTDTKVYIWATLAHKVVSLSWTFMMMFSTTALPVIWPCSLSLWNTSILSLQCFCANTVYPHFLLPSNGYSEVLPSFGHDWQRRSLAEGVSSCFSIYGVSSRHPWFPLLLCFFFLCVQLAAVSPRRTTEDLITPASLHVISFLQLACKHASANYCLLVVCVTRRVCVRERERLSHA